MTKKEFWDYYYKKNDLYDLFSKSDCSICNKNKMCFNIPIKKGDDPEIESKSICKECYISKKY